MIVMCPSRLVGGAPQVQWGWCRELQSFLFVFEQANRIILERPEYGMASYFFEIEEPMSIPDQASSFPRRFLDLEAIHNARPERTSL